MNSVLIVGSAPDAVRIQSVDCSMFSHVVAINNAWRLRTDWDYIIYPEDFPKAKQPTSISAEKIITAEDYVPEQNSFGGFIYAGGTMAFTAGYWALGALQPDVIAYLGCDMIYPEQTEEQSHFYGNGMADPLRPDITLQSLEAKSARLLAFAKSHNCRVVNISEQDQSRLLFPKMPLTEFATPNNVSYYLQENEVALNTKAMQQALAKEEELSYMAPSGRYWEMLAELDPEQLRSVDDLWLQTVSYS